MFVYLLAYRYTNNAKLKVLAKNSNKDINIGLTSLWMKNYSKLFQTEIEKINKQMELENSGYNQKISAFNDKRNNLKY